MRKHWKLSVSLLVALALMTAGCGDDDTTTTTAAPTTAAPTTAAPATTQPPATTDPPATTGAPTTAAATTVTAAGVTPLLVWADETRIPVVEAAATEFEASTGVPVEIKMVGFGDIRQDMVQQAALGEGADVFIGGHAWVGEMVANGVVEPIDLGGRRAEFFPVALDAFSFGGRLYGVPYAMETIGLFRNTALAPDAPASFEELLTMCETIEAEYCLTQPAGADAYFHYPYGATLGGYIFKYDAATGYDPSDVGLDSPEFIAGFDFLNMLVAEGHVDPAVDYGTMTDLFLNNDAAFMIDGPWSLPHAQAAVGAGTLSSYATSPFPSIDGNPGTPMVNVQGFMVNAYSLQKGLAQTFVLDYLATPRAMIQLYNVGLRAPAHLEAFNAVSTDPDVLAFGESAANGNPTPNISEMAPVWEALGAAVQEIYNQSSDVVTVLTTAAEEVRAAVAGE